MENETKQFLTAKRFDTTHTLEVSEDFSLPDYIPEVRRIVGVKTNATVDGKYRNGDELEADGCVSYTVIYLGGSGGLCSVSLNTSFDGRIPVKSTEGDVFGVDDISLSSSPENVLCRVTAPRRLTLSSKVKLRMFSQKSIPCDVMVDPAIQQVKLKKERMAHASVKTLRTNLECGGEMREREGTKVISAMGCVYIGDAKVTAAGVAIAGEARMSLLLLTPDGEYITAKGRSPLDLVVPCESTALVTAAAYGRCLSSEVDVTDDGLITWTMECDVDCDAVYGGESEINTDGYCIDCTELCTYTDATALSALRGVNGRLTISGTKPIRPEMTCAGSFGKAVFDRAELNGNKLTLFGNATVTCILCDDGEAMSEDVVIPVKYECDADSNGVENPFGKCEISVWDSSAHCDGETLSVTAELGINGVFFGERNVRYLAAIAPDPAHPELPQRNGITVCVPDPAETEWDIMKRYRVANGAPKRSGRVYIIT